MADLSHLAGRCGSCRLWGTQYELGTGYCELPGQPNAPMRGSDYGGVVTRIDFGCLWHEPAAVHIATYARDADA